jgi:ParB family chromosome partitioning protein
MNSIKKYGLLHPVIIDPEYNLIAGHRRLESAKQLGWTSIDVVIAECEDDILKLEIELEENLQRKNLSQDEISNGFTRLNKLMNPGFFQRIINFFKRLFRRLFRKRKRNKN